MGWSSMSGIPDGVLDAIIRWAATTPDVQTVWLFGSRAKGSHRIDSDIDLALGLVGWDSEDPDERNEALLAWIDEGGDWREQLQAITPLPIHLNPVSRHDGTVLPAVRREGVMLWERGA